MRSRLLGKIKIVTVVGLMALGVTVLGGRLIDDSSIQQSQASFDVDFIRDLSIITDQDTSQQILVQEDAYEAPINSDFAYKTITLIQTRSGQQFRQGDGYGELEINNSKVRYNTVDITDLNKYYSLVIAPTDYQSGIESFDVRVCHLYNVDKQQYLTKVCDEATVTVEVKD